MNKSHLLSSIELLWDSSIIPALTKYIRIPNKSPNFDSNWEANGHMQKAVQLIYDWCLEHAVPNMQLEIIQLPNRTPLLLMDIPGNSNDTVLLYGHLDKQPEMTGWDDDLGPWKPVLKNGKLYGRGAADDGYAAFASLAAIKTLQEQNISHARCLILIEASEESGSSDLPFYIDALTDRIGTPDLVICLDSGCGNYEQLWMTTSLRGLISGVLNIKILEQGIHSGSGSGVAPACARILRQLLNRIEEESTGNILLKELHTSIPPERIEQAQKAADVLGETVYAELPFAEHVTPEDSSFSEIILRRTWKPALSIIGLDGLPSIENAGNVTIPSLSVKLSMRIPPHVNPETAISALKLSLEKTPPYNAHVSFVPHEFTEGWNAPAESAWLKNAAQEASQNYFSKDAIYMGEGGSIPFMGMLGKKFPNAQFMITGLLGPGSNAHGPNEFLHISTGKKLTACVAHVLAAHYKK